MMFPSSPLRSSAFVFVALLSLAGCAASAQQPQTETTSEPTASATDTATSAPSAATAAPVASAEPSAEPKDDGATKLDTFGLPLSIRLPKDTPVEARKGASMGYSPSPGGVYIGSSFSQVKLRVFKAADNEKPIGNLKKTRRPRNSCEHKVLREEADLVVYRCAKDDHYAVLVLDLGGSSYVCESETFAKTPAELEPQIAACRTLKPL